jgi:hypothetical protein
MKKVDSEVKEWRVTCVKAYKSKATSQHEYVSATVVNPSGTTAHVAIERGRGDKSNSFERFDFASGIR